MTAPMIGNYGINQEDMESGKASVAGVVVRELAREASSWRATGPLREWLEGYGVAVVSEVDTRRLTRHIREKGAMQGVHRDRRRAVRRGAPGRSPRRRAWKDSTSPRA